MRFIEAPVFTRFICEYLTDDEYLGMQSLLLKNPEAGPLIPGSGGVRKLRWASDGKGKSGGIRVIYYLKRQDDEIWLLTVYRKCEQDNIPSHILKRIAEEIKNG